MAVRRSRGQETADGHSKANHLTRISVGAGPIEEHGETTISGARPIHTQEIARTAGVSVPVPYR
jgi:hypothetical protein